MPEDDSIDRWVEDDEEDVPTEFNVRFNDQAMFSIAAICIAVVLSIAALHCEGPTMNCRNVCKPRVVKLQAENGRCECQDAPK